MYSWNCWHIKTAKQTGQYYDRHHFTLWWTIGANRCWTTSLWFGHIASGWCRQTGQYYDSRYITLSMILLDVLLITVVPTCIYAGQACPIITFFAMTNRQTDWQTGSMLWWLMSHTRKNSLGHCKLLWCQQVLIANLVYGMVTLPEGFTRDDMSDLVGFSRTGFTLLKRCTVQS